MTHIAGSLIVDYGDLENDSRIEATNINAGLVVGTVNLNATGICNLNDVRVTSSISYVDPGTELLTPLFVPDGSFTPNPNATISDLGVITGTKIVLNTTDSQWNGANGNLSTAGTISAYNDVTSNNSANSLNTIATKTQALSDNGTVLSSSHPISVTGNVTASNITSTNSSDISANTSAISTLQSSKQNTITTGTISQYFRGDLSLATAGNLIGRSTINNRTFYVSATGNDSNDGLSEFTCFLTLTAALAAAGSTGNQIVIFPGTYAGTFTVSNQNLTIIGAQSEKGGLVNMTGGLVITNSASSVRVKGLSMATLTHSGAGGAYFEDCYFNTSVTLSGPGFTEFLNCDTQGGSFSTTTSITGAKQTVFVVNSKIGLTTINNASSFTTISNCANSLPLTLTNGTLGVSNVAVYSISPTGNAITATGGSLILNDCFCLTPANLQARISIGVGVTYGIRKADFDFTNSTISGTRASQKIIMDAAQIHDLAVTNSLSMGGHRIVSMANGTLPNDAVNKSQLDLKLPLTGGTLTGPLAGTSLNLSSDLIVGGNFTVNGTTITANSVTNLFDGYLQIDQNPASSQAALVVNQTSGSGNIVEVTDVDSNIKFLISQDCDLNINSKFTVDSATGNTSSSGTLYSASTFTTDGQANLQNGAVISGPLSATGAVTFSDTTAVKLPSGNNSERPTGVNGMIRYNSQTSSFEGFNSSWGSLGSTFNPTITSATLGDMLYYNGTSWINGLYTVAPASISFLGWVCTLPSTLVSPFSWNGSSSMDCQFRFYSDSGLTNLILDTGTLSNTNSYTGSSPSLSNSTTYYVIARVRSRLSYSNSTWSPFSAYSVFTSPSADSIANALSTNLAAYNAASANAWVQITAGEWNNVLNISGVAQYGNNALYTTSTNSDSNTSSCWNNQTTFSNQQYPIAIRYNSCGNQSGTIYFTFGTSSSITGSGSFLQFSQSGQTSGTDYFYVRKTPTTLMGSSGSNFIQTSSVGISTIGFVSSSQTFYQGNGGTFTQGLVLSNFGNYFSPVFVMACTPTKSWP